MKRTAICIMLCAVFIFSSLSVVSAVDLSIDAQTGYSFTEEDFRTVNGTLRGIFLTDVPDEAIGTVTLGTRILKEGDILTSNELSQLRLQAAKNDSGETALTYCPINGSTLGDPTTMRLFFREKKDLPPEAHDSAMETYRNVANHGELDITDEDRTTLTVSLIKPPKRGTVVFGENATYTYTPIKNKVGSDSFVYTVRDAKGNVSKPATVTITILKPADKAVYSDLDGDPDAFAAYWLKDRGLFSGERTVGRLCFGADKTVTRSEFLCMVLHLCGKADTVLQANAGFTDTRQMPQWMQTYLTSALRSGVVTGSRTDSGICFRPMDAVTTAEAAVMLQNALHLPVSQSVSLTNGTILPTWAQPSVLALAEAGIPLSVTDTQQPLTRRDCAKLLYQIAQLLSEKSFTE